MEIKTINPDNMAKPRGYSHAIAVSGNHKTIYIGGQNAIDENGALVGKGDLAKQIEQILTNIEKIVQSEKAGLGSIVKFNINLLQGQDPREGFGAFQKKWPATATPPVVTVLFVAGLGHPDWLAEIDAIAVVPEG